MPTPGIAANAYASLARLTNPAGGGLAAGISKPAADPAGQSFGALLKDALGSVEATGKKSDAQATAMVNGKANIVDVVTAVSESEVAIDALTSVRDRVIQAYDEIMKMPI